jgi:hypothetical protein
MKIAYILLCSIAFLFLTKAQDIGLGTATSFGVLGASEVTNTGLTVINGEQGVSPGTSISGFPPGTFTGSLHNNDAVTAQAQPDALVAYNVAAGLAPNTDMTGIDLGGQTLTTGVYLFTSSAQLTGTLILDAQGDSDALRFSYQFYTYHCL